MVCGLDSTLKIPRLMRGVLDSLFRIPRLMDHWLESLFRFQRLTICRLFLLLCGHTTTESSIRLNAYYRATITSRTSSFGGSTHDVFSPHGCVVCSIRCLSHWTHCCNVVRLRGRRLESLFTVPRPTTARLDSSFQISQPSGSSAWLLSSNPYSQWLVDNILG